MSTRFQRRNGIIWLLTTGRLPRFAEQFPNTTGEDVLAGEFLLCQGLRFAFDVKHPFRALEGAIMELRRYGNIEVRAIAVEELASLVSSIQPPLKPHLCYAGHPNRLGTQSRP